MKGKGTSLTLLWETMENHSVEIHNFTVQMKKPHVNLVQRRYLLTIAVWGAPQGSVWRLLLLSFSHSPSSRVNHTSAISYADDTLIYVPNLYSRSFFWKKWCSGWKTSLKTRICDGLELFLAKLSYFMTAASLQKISEQHKTPSRLLFWGCPFINKIMPKPDPARITKVWLRRKRMKVSDWPASSSDPHPTEDVWHLKPEMQ